MTSPKFSSNLLLIHLLSAIYYSAFFKHILPGIILLAEYSCQLYLLLNRDSSISFISAALSPFSHSSVCFFSENT